MKAKWALEGKEGEKKREGDGETRRRGTWLPATSPAGLLNYTHTRAAKCIRTSAVYMIQNRIRSLKRTHTLKRFWNGGGGQMRQDVNGTHRKLSLLHAYTHIEAYQGAQIHLDWNHTACY